VTLEENMADLIPRRNLHAVYAIRLYQAIQRYGPMRSNGKTGKACCFLSMNTISRLIFVLSAEGGMEDLFIVRKMGFVPNGALMKHYAMYQ